MLRGCAFILLITVNYCSFAQRHIHGTVIDLATGKAVPGSSVFISNTSRGTSTNASGQFELRDVPDGKHELVVSSIGYETYVRSFTGNELPLELQIKLRIKVKELQEVILEPYEEEGWDKWGRLFLDNFIGTTANASRCHLKNKDAIKFRYYKNSRRMIAIAREPLIIDNNVLGYRIKYQLEQFEVNFKENTAIFLGYPLFEEYAGKGMVRRSRETAYLGSMMHFMRSLYHDSLSQNGFTVRLMSKQANPEKLRVSYIYRPIKSLTLGKGTSSAGYETTRPGILHSDSIKYYREVLEQPDQMEVYGEPLLSAASLIVKMDGAYKLLYFPDYLYVTYMMETEERGFLISRNIRRKPGIQQSYLFLTSNEGVWIESNGHYYNPTDIYSLGYWGWSEKMAENLPLDFQLKK